MTSVTARHILVASQEEAEGLLAKIKEGTSFEELAAKHSKCPSGKDGGGLGSFGKGQMVPAFEQAAFALEENQISEPVKTDFGFHLIERLPG